MKCIRMGCKYSMHPCLIDNLKPSNKYLATPASSHKFFLTVPSNPNAMSTMQIATNSKSTGQIPYKYSGDTISLLSKYDISIAHLEFSYVEKCDDGKELERILQILKSGEEGYYPELMKTVENKLRMIHPKSKYLRNVSRILSKEELEKEEWKQINEDLNEWIVDVSKDNKELALKKGQKTPNEMDMEKVRECKQISEKKRENNPQKIKSTDYAAWDSYDVDAEILKMDINEEKMKEEAIKEKPSKPKKKQVKFNLFATDVESKTVANDERQKGNEYFRACDYNSALRHYTASVDCLPTIDALNNRALTFVKLARYEDAIKDCDSVVRLDPVNWKAYWRKAIALDRLGQSDSALDSIELCIDINPNNSTVQDLANAIRKKCNKSDLTKRRLLVQNVESGNNETNYQDEESDKIEIVPIPGTSTMPEPYYLTCRSDDLKTITEQLYMKKTEQEYPYISDNKTGDDFQEFSMPSDASNAEENQEIKEEQDIEIRRKSKNIQRIRETPIEMNSSNDKYAGGEPFEQENVMNLPEDIHSPYTFLKIWNSVRDDVTLKKQAHILKNMNMQRLVEVIGCKLDNNLFSVVLKTLCSHFTVPGEIEKVYSVLLNFPRLPRFHIISMLMSDEDRSNLNMLLSFLQQHDKILPKIIRKSLIL